MPNKAIEAHEALLDELKELAAESKLKPGSPELESFLGAGYPKIGTKKHAQEIIADWGKDHSSCPYQLMEDAKAFLLALNPPAEALKVYHPPTDHYGRLTVTKRPRRERQPA